jgi:hypothetical protein
MTSSLAAFCHRRSPFLLCAQGVTPDIVVGDKVGCCVIRHMQHGMQASAPVIGARFKAVDAEWHVVSPCRSCSSTALRWSESPSSWVRKTACPFWHGLGGCAFPGGPHQLLDVQCLASLSQALQISETTSSSLFNVTTGAGLDHIATLKCRCGRDHQTRRCHWRNRCIRSVVSGAPCWGFACCSARTQAALSIIPVPVSNA